MIRAVLCSSMMHLDLYGVGRGNRSREAQVVRLGGRGAATKVRSAASEWVLCLILGGRYVIGESWVRRSLFLSAVHRERAVLSEWVIWERERIREGPNRD